MTLATPPARGATGWDTWLVAALTQLDGNDTNTATSLATATASITSLTAAVQTLIFAVNDLKNQQQAPAPVVWG